MAYKNHLHTPH